MTIALSLKIVAALENRQLGDEMWSTNADKAAFERARRLIVSCYNLAFSVLSAVKESEVHIEKSSYTNSQTKAIDRVPYLVQCGPVKEFSYTYVEIVIGVRVPLASSLQVIRHSLNEAKWVL